MRDYKHFLFYSEHIESDRLFLDPSESRHMVAVLRRGQGDPFLATDARGALYECRVASIDKKQLTGLIIDRNHVPRHACALRLFVGIPERDAFERLIADLTALGVERITPLVCRYCQTPWWERSAGGEAQAERFRKKMVAAMKQSLYPWLPLLDPPLPFANLSAEAAGPRLAADPQGAPLSALVDTVNKMPLPLTAIVGPPGGFAPEEEASLAAHGAQGVRLAPTRLTTGLAALSLCSQLIGLRPPAPPSAPFPGTAA